MYSLDCFIIIIIAFFGHWKLCIHKSIKIRKIINVVLWCRVCVRYRAAGTRLTCMSWSWSCLALFATSRWSSLVRVHHKLVPAQEFIIFIMSTYRLCLWVIFKIKYLLNVSYTRYLFLTTKSYSYYIFIPCHHVEIVFYDFYD